mmetsp:Transcript_3762/g.9549  ORF Transcript_3762/g.9549 Transcript_3762/m.9549 type:complete len:341 (+) Transcript_3762:54-1076(+)
MINYWLTEGITRGGGRHGAAFAERSSSPLLLLPPPLRSQGFDRGAKAGEGSGAAGSGGVSRMSALTLGGVSPRANRSSTSWYRAECGAPPSGPSGAGAEALPMSDDATTGVAFPASSEEAATRVALPASYAGASVGFASTPPPVSSSLFPSGLVSELRSSSLMASSSSRSSFVTATFSVGAGDAAGVLLRLASSAFSDAASTAALVAALSVSPNARSSRLSSSPLMDGDGEMLLCNSMLARSDSALASAVVTSVILFCSSALLSARLSAAASSFWRRLSSSSSFSFEDAVVSALLLSSSFFTDAAACFPYIAMTATVAPNPSATIDHDVLPLGVASDVWF